MSHFASMDLESPHLKDDVATQSHSCALCQKRKVKCDRLTPCSGCVKADVQCIYRAPLPPRRRKRKAETNVFTLLKKYEELLERHGIDPRSVADGSRLDIPQRPLPSSHYSRGATSDINMATPTMSSRSEPDSQIFERAKLISKDEKSFYVDNNLWTAVTNEISQAEALLDESQDEDSDYLSEVQTYADPLGEGALLFGTSSSEGLAKFHPSPVHIFKLWHVFLENVNPLTKIIHAPTLQTRILEATSDLKSVSKEFEALMFAIYSTALYSMTEEEVRSSFGEAKATLFSRFQDAAKQSLINAGLLRTSNLTVLQAFLLFLLSVRTTYDSRSLWSLSGIAVRIAQRLGLHRDGSQLGLSVFETEMRRRLWWQLVVVDTVIGHMSGSVSPPVPMADTQPPRNLNDSDLHPTMKDIPPEHPGATEMVFCLARYEIGKWLQRQAGPKNIGFGGHWREISGANTVLSEKDRMIDDLRDAMEQDILSHLDLSIPLHFVTSVVAQSAVHIIRLMAHHPRNYREQGLPMTQDDKDSLFDLCLKVAELGDHLYLKKSMQRYLWHVDYHFPWDALIFMLEELRHRRANEKTEQAWRLIDVIYSRQQQQKLLRKVNSPFHLAVSNLILKAWAATAAEFQRAGRPPPPQPRAVAFVWKDMGRRKAGSQNWGISSSDTVTFSNPQISSKEPVPALRFDDRFDLPPNPEPIPVESLTMTDFGTIGDSPMDWEQWDNLLQQFQQDSPEDQLFQPLDDPL